MICHQAGGRLGFLLFSFLPSYKYCCCVYELCFILFHLLKRSSGKDVQENDGGFFSYLVNFIQPATKLPYVMIL